MAPVVSWLAFLFCELRLRGQNSVRNFRGAFCSPQRGDLHAKPAASRSAHLYGHGVTRGSRQVIYRGSVRGSDAQEFSALRDFFRANRASVAGIGRGFLGISLAAARSPSLGMDGRPTSAAEGNTSAAGTWLSKIAQRLALAGTYSCIFHKAQSYGEGAVTLLRRQIVIVYA